MEISPGTTHSPAAGLKVMVYVPGAKTEGLKELPVSIAPDQVPLIPSCTKGSETDAPLLQYGPNGLRVGIAGGIISTVIMEVPAHGCNKGSGVNVYNVVFVLLIAGDHVPVMPLVEVNGSVNELP